MNRINTSNTLNYSKDLVLYRTNIRSIRNQNFKIAFYGLSKRGIRTYFKEEPVNSAKFYYKFNLPKDLTKRIINLEDPVNQQIIEDYLKKNKVHNSIKNGNLNSIREAFPFSENNNKYFRFSNNSNVDRKFGFTLQKIFPDYIGSYTKGGNGLNHAEVIIWNEEVNKFFYDFYDKITPDPIDIIPPNPKKKKREQNNNNNKPTHNPGKKIVF